MNPQNSQSGNSLICRHIKVNGRRCQAFAIGSGVYCYYHRTLNRGHRTAAAVKMPALRPESVQYLLQNGLALPRDPKPLLHFPPLEDADSIQLALSMLFTAVLAGQIQAAYARTLLYTLQIASFNVRSTSSARASAAASTSEEEQHSTVAHCVVRNRHGQALAAPDESNGVPSQPGRTQSSLAAFERDCDREKTLEAQSTPLQPLKLLGLMQPEPIQCPPVSNIE